MSQFLTPLGLILSDDGDFEALTPAGGIIAEDEGAGPVPFSLAQSGVTPVLGGLSVLGDVATDFTPTFDLGAVDALRVDVSGALGVFGSIEHTTTAPSLAEVAQYVTPFGGIITKDEAFEFQLLHPLKGAFVDDIFAFEFQAVPGTNYLTPFGGLLVKLGGGEHQFPHTLEASVVDDGPLTEVYERAVEQYITPFGFILEKTDGENFQALLSVEGFVDNNYEFDEPVTSFEFAAVDGIALHWLPAISGDIFGGVAGPGFEVEGPLTVNTIIGTLGISGGIETYVSPFDVEGPLYVTQMQAALALIGNLEYTVAVDQPFNFIQVGAFTVRGVTAIDPAVFDYAPGPAVPHDIAQVGAVALNGVVKVLGQLQTATSFELLTQPILLDSVMTVSGPLDFPFPSIIDFVQLGEITLVGTLTIGDTKFRFDSFTEGLPRGWYVDGPILETVPNPNYGTAYGNAFFRRWTWKGYDPAGTMVAASGSEQDCIAQTLSVCQSRHQEDWHNLAR
jgi:hypothetical protein